MSILAHGIGGRSDLPIPLWMAMYGGAAAVLISFFALTLFWREPRLVDSGRGIVFPPGLDRLLSSRATRALARAIGAFFWLAMLVVSLGGANDSSLNPAPYWFYIWFWVGLVPLSVLFGPVWRVLNPLRPLSSAALRFIHGEKWEEEVEPWPRRLAHWPAVTGLAAFVILELIYSDADRPLVVGGFLLVYSVAQFAGSMRYGMTWYEKADGFEVYSSLLGRLSPFGRRSGGRLVMRNPLRGLAHLEQDPFLVPVVAVLLGSTAFDGLTRTRIWNELSIRTTGVANFGLGLAGLAGAICIVAITYRSAMRQSAGFLPSATGSRLAGVFVHSLVPIVIGYTIAHYFSLLVFEGQAGYILASDPFGKGWDLFGTADNRVDFSAFSPQVVGFIQTTSIVIGHIVGVVAAHDRAMEIFPDQLKTRAQYSLLGVMVLYTASGIALLVGA
jgi:hypothetical protein